jgi:hypothetical protein
MNSRHPSGAELQQFVDGELPSIRAHVEVCPVCGTEISAIQDMLAECALHRESILPGEFVPPPRPWADLQVRFAEADQPRAPWFSWNIRAWAMAAAMVALGIGLFLRFRETPTVQAAELLRKAVAAAAPASKPHRIQVRTRTGASTLKSWQARFTAAHFDGDNPLSARAYAAWRDQLPEKRDDVVRERDLYRIRTDTGSGELMTATLTLRIDDLRPVSERLEFRDRDWVELTEAPQEESGPRTEITKSSAKAEAPVPVVPSVVSPATLGDELRVFAALHRIGADLGDPIEISRKGADVQISAAGLSPQRQQQIRDALTALPNAVIDFSDRFSNNPSAPKLQPRNRVAPTGGASPDVLQLQSRIADQVGGREQFDEVSARVLDLSESMMARAYALRRLAEHFPAAADLSPDDRQTLAGLRADHIAALRQTVGQMDRVLKPVLSNVPPASAGAATQSTENLFQAARRVDRCAAVMFGNAPDSTPVASLPAQLTLALADLRAEIGDQ